jgi:acyl-CoA thioester hydrolase
MHKPITFFKKIKVKAEVIDHFNHVNNLEYIKWVLKISKEHWNSVTPAEIQNQFGWMILRHEVNYKGQAKLDDELLIKTWIKDFSTARSTRKTTITHVKTDKLILASEANWCFVSLKTQKPVRLTSEILNPFFENL